MSGPCTTADVLPVDVQASEDKGNPGSDTRVQPRLVNMPVKRVRPVGVGRDQFHCFDWHTSGRQRGCSGVRVQLG